MVTINLTLFVLLAMFLAFLWAMHRFIFRPVLALMDQREQKMAEDRAVAREASADAERIEDEYKHRLAAIHREANVHITRARRAAQEQHQAQVDAFKKRADEELQVLRKEIRSDVNSQRDQFGPLAHEIANAMAKKLELE